MKFSPEFNETLPYDEFAEKAVLGAMLIENKYINEVLEELNSDDFYRNAHKINVSSVFNISAGGKAVDTVTLAGALDKKELKFVGGYEYLNSLVDAIPENLNIEEYIKTIKDKAILRKIIMTSVGVIKDGVEPRVDTRHLLTKLQEDIIKIADIDVKHGFRPSREILPQTIERIEHIINDGTSGGLKTGFYEIDQMTGGFQSSDLIIIASRPSMGKTALALNMAVNMSIKNGKSVGFFSIEMSQHQILTRLLSQGANIDMSALITGKRNLSQQEWNSLELSAAELEKTKLYIDDSASLSIIDMKTRARRLYKERGLDIVFVDYLQLIKVTREIFRSSDSRAREVALITASLKELAKELNIPVVALAQLNRAPEQRGGRGDQTPRYQLSDLKESGSIEQDADVIMFLHREEQINKDTERKGEADLIIAKQRNGPTGRMVLAFIPKYTKFANMEFRA